jgi:uncharacterized membrane protein (UPF0127 family)
VNALIEHHSACAVERGPVSRSAFLRRRTLVTSLAAVTWLGAIAPLGCGRAEPTRTQPAASAASAHTPTPSASPRLDTAAPASAAAPGASAAPGANASATPGAVATSTARRCIAPWPKSSAPRVLPASSCPSAPGAGPTLPRGSVQFLDAPGTPAVSVERALDDDMRALGLMYRTHMDADHGMLFSWGEEETRSFWMRNTCIPLDMLFIAGDGTIVGILEQVPTLNTLPRSVPCPAQHVLELNAGWARKHGVAPGQRVQIET